MNYNNNNYNKFDQTMHAFPMKYSNTVPRMTPPNQDQLDSIYIYPQNLEGALDLMKQAVQGETEDRMFYSYLIEQAPSEEDETIIIGIRDNEINHFKLFNQVYYQITGKPIPAIQSEEFTKPASYCDGLKRALLGEQNAVQKYRKILYAMQSRIHINILTGIITDEIRHGILYSYLYSKNGCKE